MSAAAARGLALAVLVAVGLVAGPSVPSEAEPESYAVSATFAAAPGSPGTVPEDLSVGCGNGTASALDLPFDVTGLPPGPVAGVSLELSLDHGWAGDVAATLVAPDATAHPLFGATGAVARDDCGDESYLDGQYVFTDAAGAGDWWAAAAATGNWDALPRGSYRSSVPGLAAGAGTPTSITAAFEHLTSAEGTWLLRVVDRTGDMWGNGVTWPGRVHGARLTVTVASSGPDTTVLGPADGAVVTEPPTYVLSSPHAAAVTGYECRVDGGAWQPCASPYTPVTGSGTHALDVRAVDARGNADPVPATTTFTYHDGRPPGTEFVGGPVEGALVDGPTPYAFGSPDADVAGYRCRLDDRDAVDCTSPFEVRTPPGPHTLSVSAVDLSGNVDPTPATRSFAMDPARCERASERLADSRRALRRAERREDRAAVRRARERVRRAERAHAAACEWPPPAP